MSELKNQSRVFACLFLWIMLFNSCVAYGPPVQMEEAVRSSERTRVKYTDDVIHRYEYVIEEEGIYYGVTKRKGALVKTEIDVVKLENVRLYSKSKSTMATVVTPIALLGVAVLVAWSTIDVSPW